MFELFSHSLKGDDMNNLDEEKVANSNQTADLLQQSPTINVNIDNFDDDYKLNNLTQVESKVWQGIKLEKDNRLDEAIECYRQAVKINSSSAVANHLLAISLKKRGNLTEADFYHRQALSLGKTRNTKQDNLNNKISIDRANSAITLPKVATITSEAYVNNSELEVAEIYLQQAIVYYEQKNWQKSIIACQEAINICPDLAAAYKIYGNSLQKMDKTAEAMGYYAKALAKDSNMAEVYANIASIYAQQSQWQQAIDYYKKALAVNPNLAKVYLQASRVWEKLGEQEYALNCLLQALSLEPEIFTPQQHLKLADDLLTENKVKLAITCYQYAIQLAPDFKDAYLKLIKALEKDKQWQKAAFYYREIIRIQEASLKSNSQASTLTENSKKEKLLLNNNLDNNQLLLPAKPNKFNESGKSVIAKRKINQATVASINYRYSNQLRSNSNPSKKLFELGNLFAKKQDWQQAIFYYQQAIEIEPNMANAYINLGKVYGHTGKSLQGAEKIYQGYSLQPALVSPEEHCKLGDFFVNHGKIQLAMSCYRRAIQLKSDFTEAYNKLQNLIENIELTVNYQETNIK